MLLDEVGSERPALFGCFDSGALCALFAATYPERASALVLFAPAVVGAATDYAWAWPEATWSSYMDELANGWGTRPYAEKVFPGFNPSLADDDGAVGWWARFMRQAASPNAAVAIERMWHEIDVRPVLATIRVPTLVLHRADDAGISVEAGRDTARRIPGAKFIELPGVDSYPWAGDQDGVLDEVEEFLTGVRHGPRSDRVLATVLFTDIVGSTEWAVELGDAAWNGLLEEHHARALVFDRDDCVGWCQFGAPDEVPKIKNRAAYEKSLTTLPDWRIACNFVGKGHRRQGVATAALAGALDLIASLGGGKVEGYPEGAGAVPAGFLFNGAVSTYEELGFVRDRKIGKHRWVVTKVVEPTS